MLGRDIVICDPVRTAVGAFQGALAGVPVAELAGTAIRGVLDRSGIDPDRVDDVVHLPTELVTRGSTRARFPV